MSDTARMRVDKWLWVARFFKTRSLASTAISGHKVKCNGEHLKPAREIKLGDELEILIGESRFVVIVQGLVGQRRSASEARLLYTETPESIACRCAQQALHQMAPTPGSTLKGRPTKREGRLIRSLRD